MPGGKGPGIPCPHLTEDLRCGLYADPRRPRVCSSLRPSVQMCGASREEALEYLGRLEKLTAPGE